MFKVNNKDTRTTPYNLRLFKKKRLRSPGTYISEQTWDPSQKAITK